MVTMEISHPRLRYHGNREEILWYRNVLLFTKKELNQISFVFNVTTGF